MLPVSTIHCPVRRCHQRSGSVAGRAVIASSPKNKMPANTPLALINGILARVIRGDYKINVVETPAMGWIALPQNKQKIAIALLLTMSLSNAVIIYNTLPLLRRGYQDFTIFYTAGRLVLE